MSVFPDRLRLKEQADEDIYFARRDQALIAQLRARRPGSLSRIISGGQTGVDRAALDIAIEHAAALGFAVGGWCPRGRWAEDGIIPERYPLEETPLADPAQRTEWNVRDADATLILYRRHLAGGSALTARIAERLGRPLRCIDLERSWDLDSVRGWLQQCGIHVLNIAGPRESDAPGIGAHACAWLRELLSAPKQQPETQTSTGG